MLPNHIQRSDQHTTQIQTQFPFIQCIFKCLIILIFPACLLESSWLVGTHNNSIIYCGLSHTISNNNVIQYNTLCNTGYTWACELSVTSLNTKVCLLIYYFSYLTYTIVYIFSFFSSRILRYTRYIPELYLILPLNIFLYITLLCFANFIPHKFDNTLVEFDSSFGVAYICCNLHIADTLQSVSHVIFTSFEINDFFTKFYQKIKSFTITEQYLLSCCIIQLALNLPLFLKPHNFNPQNVSPLFALIWIFSKYDILYNTYITLCFFTLFSGSFKLSMMKQSKYDTATELCVNILFVCMFILHFISLTLIYLIQHTIPNKTEPSPKHTPSLSKHMHTIRAAHRITHNHNQNNNPSQIHETENNTNTNTNTNVHKFTIT